MRNRPLKSVIGHATLHIVTTVLFVTLANTIITGNLIAAEIAWTNVLGGSFGVSANWDPNTVPANADDARFALGQSPAYTVTLDAERTITRFALSDDNVALDLAGNALTITATNSTTYGLAVGYDADATLVIEGGESVYLDTFIVGFNANATLIVQGADTRLHAPDAAFNEATIGSSSSAGSGTGLLEVRDGARVNVERFMLGRNGGDRGLIRVTGAGSLANGSGVTQIGYRGGGDLEALDGGRFNLGSVVMGYRPALCTVTVSNGILNALSVTMGLLTRNNTSIFTVLNGGELTTRTAFTAGSSDGDTASVRFAGTNANGTATSVAIGDRHTGTGRNGFFGRVDGTVTWDLTIEDHAEVDFAQIFGIRPNGTFTLDKASVKASQLSWFEGAEFALVLHTGAFDAPLEVLARGDFTGQVDLRDTTFTPIAGPGFTSAIKDTFTVIRYEGVLNDAFKDMPDGHIIKLNDMNFVLSYGTGSNSAITLTHIGPTGSLFMVR